jgi:hypothetical protein
MEEPKMHTKFLLGKLKRRDRLEGLGVDENMYKNES